MKSQNKLLSCAFLALCCTLYAPQGEESLQMSESTPVVQPSQLRRVMKQREMEYAKHCWTRILFTQDEGWNDFLSSKEDEKPDTKWIRQLFSRLQTLYVESRVQNRAILPIRELLVAKLSFEAGILRKIYDALGCLRLVDDAQETNIRGTLIDDNSEHYKPIAQQALNKLAPEEHKVLQVLITLKAVMWSGLSFRLILVNIDPRMARYIAELHGDQLSKLFYNFALEHYTIPITSAYQTLLSKFLELSEMPLESGFYDSETDREADISVYRSLLQKSSCNLSRDFLTDCNRYTRNPEIQSLARQVLLEWLKSLRDDPWIQENLPSSMKLLENYMRKIDPASVPAIAPQPEEYV